MADVQISLTCADYARVMPLATGEVKPEGIALTMILGSRGSWPARAEMLRRAVQDETVQGGEWSMAQYLYRIEKGDRSHVGLPVFPLRNFTARDLYVRRGGPVRRPEDLAGRRIGMYSYTASGSIWYRHFLRFVGLDPAAIEWWIGDIDTPWSAPMDADASPGREGPRSGSIAVGHAGRGGARGDLQPAPPAGLPSRRWAPRPTVPRLPRRRAGVFRADRRLPATAPRRHPARDVAGAPMDRQEPHRGVHRRQRLLHRGPEGLPVRDAVAGGGARGHGRRDGRRFPPVRLRAEPRADRQFAAEAFRLGLTSRQIPAEEYFADFLAS